MNNPDHKDKLAGGFLWNKRIEQLFLIIKVVRLLNRLSFPYSLFYFISVAEEPAVWDGSPEAGAEWNAAQRRGQHAHGLTPYSFPYRSVSITCPIENISTADLDLSDPYVFWPSGSGSFYHQAKIV
jgi:hypothetical protein